jgi:uncharacterized cupin superfamily protein
MRLIKPASLPLAAVPLGPGYSGPETYHESETVSTADGALTIGAWSYDGELRSVNPGKMHHAWIVTRGSISVEQSGDRVQAEAGDVVMFEAPYPGKVVSTSSDFLATWISVPVVSE